MKKSVIALLSLASMFSTPGFAQGEGGVELRSTAVGNGHGAGLLVGAGAGYDWDLGEKLFIGGQATGEVSVQGDFGSIAGVVRFGPKLGSKSKLYVLGGIGALPGFDDVNAHPVVGGGLQIGIGRKIYGKLEYRQSLGTNVRSGDEGNSGNLHHIGIAVGLKF